MRRILLTFLACIGIFTSQAQQAKTLYDFSVKTIDGKELPLSKFKGKKVLVVNVASKCGLTPQYKELELLYRTYARKGLVILGFPANNFNGQEPGTNEEIATFCKQQYEVSFPVMSKVSVKGDDQTPLYQWLTQKTLNGVADAPVQWNFQKFLIDENGHWVDVVSPRESPMSARILSWLNGSKSR